MRALDTDGVQNLLRFVTGVAAVKATSEVDGSDAVKVEIYTDPERSVPTASTCAKEMYLPAFETEEEFRSKLCVGLEQFRVEHSRVGGAQMMYQ